MTHEEAFLQAISEQPDDDAPRLIYADWLEEHGKAAFAQFIRVQCELARHPQEDERWLELKIEEEDLWAQLQRHWGEHFRHLNPYRATQLAEFKRGFLDNAGLTTAPAVFVKESPCWIFLLGVAGFTMGDAMCDDFFACPQLWRVRSMNCERCTVKDSAMLGFADARHFHNLQRIDFFRNYIGTAGTTAFARCPSLTNLTELLLDENKLGDEGVQALVASPVCRNLVTLRLNDNGITDAGALAVAASPHLVNLRSLNLNNNGITRAGAEAVRASPHLANIRELHLYVDEEEDGIEAEEG
jgi:uncharacterized protein (TIGR02996 family)